MKEADKNTLIELCGQLKAKLQHKNKIYHVLMIDANNEDFSDVYDDMIDELYEKWCEYFLCLLFARLTNFCIIIIKR